MTIAAALTPCPREAQILAAVAPWRVAQAPPHARWTDTLAGWFGAGAQHAKAPAHVVDAIRAAYPLPATVTEAVDEHGYWEARNAELGELLGPAYDVGGGRFLDLPADLRAAIVRDIAERELPARTVADLRARFRLLRARGARDGAAIETALSRDLDALAQAEPAGVAGQTLGDRIAAALRASPEAADREIARRLGCSNVMVSRSRHALGLVDVPRTIRRGDQAYPMKPRGAQAARNAAP